MIENSNFFSEIEILFSKNEDDPSGKNERDGEREKNENEEERKKLCETGGICQPLMKRTSEREREKKKCKFHFIFIAMNQKKTKVDFIFFSFFNVDFRFD